MSLVKPLLSVGMVLLGIILYFTETTKIPYLSLGYSKFRENGVTAAIPTAYGMFFLYFCPALAAAISMVVGLSSINPSILAPVNLVSLLFLIHFAKRCLEVLFVHSYSGPIDLLTSFMIASLYTIIVVGSWYLVPTTADTQTWMIVLGLCIVAVGEFGNYYHHAILRDLRKPKQNAMELATRGADQKPTEKAYVLPVGGLFSLLVCPHYTFEIVSFLGIAAASGFDYFELAVTVAVAIYLGTRSMLTKKWYLEKGFDRETIQQRRILVPYIL
ncbi:hypothetical protein HDV03_001692 [Kappamyces sp. JEL0829]|nr:hypothetical protein HDV03_001692 [Kappamyces sp. JEL0829]